MSQIVSYLTKYCLGCGKVATTVYPIKIEGKWVGEYYGCRDCHMMGKNVHLDSGNGERRGERPNVGSEGL